MGAKLVVLSFPRGGNNFGNFCLPKSVKEEEKVVLDNVIASYTYLKKADGRKEIV